MFLSTATYYLSNFYQTPKSPSDPLCGDFSPTAFGGWTPFFLERGPFQKESLSEYGSGWEWEYNTYAHAFDQEYTLNYKDEYGYDRIKIIPHRYSDNGTVQSNCDNDTETTFGEILFGGSVMRYQESCKPNTGNAGNHYSWPAATVGGYHTTNGFNELNSVCPTGWQLTVNAETKVKSWYYLIRNVYNIQDNNDSKLLPLPMSFILSGRYEQGSLKNRASYGYYWSSAVYNTSNAYHLFFNSGGLNPQYGNLKHYGFSVRCVSR